MKKKKQKWKSPDRKPKHDKKSLAVLHTTPDRLLTDADLCLIFHRTPSTIYRWRTKGYLPFRRIGKSVYYSQREINIILSQREQVIP